MIYTVNRCPAGTKMATVDGGNVKMLGGSPPKSKGAGASHDGPKSLRDALDLSGNENIKDKVMERAINKLGRIQRGVSGGGIARATP